MSTQKIFTLYIEKTSPKASGTFKDVKVGDSVAALESYINSFYKVTNLVKDLNDEFPYFTDGGFKYTAKDDFWNYTFTCFHENVISLPGASQLKEGEGVEETLDEFLNRVNAKQSTDGYYFFIYNGHECVGKSGTFNQTHIEFMIRPCYKNVDIGTGVAGKSIWLKLKINPLPEVKEPLFISFDGKNIYEGDEMWLLSTDNWIIAKAHACKEPFKGDKGQLLYFSTKQVADQYIFKTKPLLSYREVMDIVNKVSDGAEGHDSKNYINGQIHELVSSKLQQP